MGKYDLLSNIGIQSISYNSTVLTKSQQIICFLNVQTIEKWLSETIYVYSFHRALKLISFSKYSSSESSLIIFTLQTFSSDMGLTTDVTLFSMSLSK